MKKYTPAYVEEIIEHSCEGPRGRCPALRVGQEGGDLLRHGHHPAHHRHGQREEPGKPGHALRQRGDRERGRESAVRTEQRAGRLRHGCPPECVHRVPGGGRPGRAEEIRRGLGRLSAGQAGADDGGDHERGPRGNDQGPVHHGREPDGERSGPHPRGGVPEEPQVSRRAGHLPHGDGPVGPRGPSCGDLCREGRHLHEHRKTGPAGPEGHRARGPVPARPGDSR